MNRKKLYFIMLLIGFLPTLSYVVRSEEGSASFRELFLFPAGILAFSIGLEIATERLAEKNRLPKKLKTPICISVPLLYAIEKLEPLLRREGFPSEKWMSMLGAVLIIVVGNYLPKTKPSRFVGLKFGWLLDKPVLWYKVHRLAGVLWIFAGVLLLLFGISFQWRWILIYFSLLYVIPLFYSLILVMKEEEMK